ncbi:MAG TPA: MFS transporter [Rhizomicrobium sp.]|jgi:Na+/melibiose symporter-like transporter|nr:MFS transporter [Rhizomicrobium sp.]
MDATATPVARNLPSRLLAPFSSAGMPVAALTIPLAVYLPNYFTSHIGLSLGEVGIAFTAVRFIDIALDSLIGISINATDTPLGRFRPWMLAGVPMIAIATYMLFMAVPGISLGYMICWLLVLYAGFSMLTVSHAAWAAALVPEYHQRSRVYGWVQAVGVISTVVTLILPILEAARGHKAPSDGIHAMGWFIIALTPLTILLCTTTVGEPKIPERVQRITLRDYGRLIARASLLRILAADLFLALGPAITAALYIFFFTQALGFTRLQTGSLLLTYIAAGLVGAPTWAQVAKRLGKHRTVMLGCVLYGFAQAFVFFGVKGNMLFMMPSMFFAGFVVSCFTFLIRAMVADISDEVRLDLGVDRAALLYGLITSTSKIGGAASVGITFSILGAFSFNRHEGAINTGLPLYALEACYVVVPILTMFVGAFALWGYKLDAVRHDGIRAALDARDRDEEVEADVLAGAAGVIESLGGPDTALAATVPFSAGE